MSEERGGILQLLMQILGGAQPQSPVVQQLATEQSPYQQATAALHLTPQEQYLYQMHLNNLQGEGKVTQPNGDISTLLQAVVTGPDGKFYSIPTVWGGQALDPQAAAQRAGAIGWDKWPSYASPDEADARYESMHKFIDMDTAKHLQQSKAGGR